MKYLFILLTSLSLLFAPVISAAPVEGVVTKVNIANGKFWLGKKKFSLHKSIPIKIDGEDEETLKIGQLNIGDYVAVRYTKGKKNKRNVVDMTIFPQ